MFSASDYDSSIFQRARTMDGHSFLPLQQMRPAVSHDAQSVVDLTAELQTAVKFGHTSAAVDLAKRLAEIRPTLSAKLETDSRPAEPEMNLRVCIYDKNSCIGNDIMKIRSSMTVEALKLMAFLKYGYSPEIQTWIVGKQLARDEDTLIDLGINFEDAVAFLYILTSSDSFGFSGNTVPITTRTLDLNLSRGISNRSQSSYLAEEEDRWICNKCTYKNKLTDSTCEICQENRPNSALLYSQIDRDMNSASNILDQHAAGYDSFNVSRPNL